MDDFTDNEERMWRAGSLAERSDVLTMVSLERQHSVGGLEAREPLLEPCGIGTVLASRQVVSARPCIS